MLRHAFLWMFVCLSLAACGSSTSTTTQLSQSTTAAPTAAAPTVAAPASTATRPAATAAPTTAQPTTALPTASAAAPTVAPAAGSTATQPAAPTAAPQAAATAGQAAAPATTVMKLNLNTASANDFLAIPGVGDRMVREFQEYKPYTSILQFRREIGKYVNVQQVAEYEKYVYVPIDVNQADAATLQQISGLDATEVAALIAGRPYASADAFFAKLAQYVSPDELARAKSYVSAP